METLEEQLEYQEGFDIHKHELDDTVEAKINRLSNWELVQAISRALAGKRI